LGIIWYDYGGDTAIYIFTVHVEEVEVEIDMEKYNTRVGIVIPDQGLINIGLYLVDPTRTRDVERKE
jgi:hypothetical protein